MSPGRTRSGRPPSPIDRVECVRAASASFTVLLLGGALVGIVTHFVPTSRFWWLPLVAVIGYFVAGSRIGDAGRPPLQGAVAALGAWGFMAIGRLAWGFAGYTPIGTFAELLPAIGIGGLAGWLAARRADRAAALKRQREVEERRARATGKAARRTQRRGPGNSGGPGKPGR